MFSMAAIADARAFMLPDGEWYPVCRGTTAELLDSEIVFTSGWDGEMGEFSNAGEGRTWKFVVQRGDVKALRF